MTTKRVTGSPSGGNTKRVSFGTLLLLEGDQDGFLLLEGDVQSGTDRLSLEGDMSFPGGTITGRVAHEPNANVTKRVPA